MSTVWNKLIDASLKMQNELEELSLTKHIHDFPWPAISYYNPNLFRRADLDIIDAREERKLWMMHLVVYPHLNDPAPIYGFDVIAGPNKVTGAFHDYSPVDPNHFMMSEFHSRAAKFIPSKKRDLPDWAKAIFSGSMISAGNVRDGDELVVTRIDRLARSVRDLQNIVHELEQKNVKLVCTEQPVDTSNAMGKMFLDL